MEAPSSPGGKGGFLASRSLHLVWTDRFNAALARDGDLSAVDARLTFTAPSDTRDAVHGHLSRLWEAREEGMLEAML